MWEGGSGQVRCSGGQQAVFQRLPNMVNRSESVVQKAGAAFRGRPGLNSQALSPALPAPGRLGRSGLLEVLGTCLGIPVPWAGCPVSGPGPARAASR